MSADLSQLIPEFEPYARDLVMAAGQAGLQPRVTSTRRSHAEQQRLYRRYLAGLSQFPAAPPGRSAHEFGYAFDMVVEPMDALGDVGAVWLDAGGVWGPNDPIHFEFPGFTPAGTYGADPTLVTATDFLTGKWWASVATMFPGLSQNELLNALANPVATLDPYMQEVIAWMRQVGILYKR